MISNRVVRYLYRGLRKTVLRPLAQLGSSIEVIEQLERLRSLGAGIAVNGPLTLGNPAEIEIGDDVCINPYLVVRGTGSLKLGDHVHFGEHVEILTSNHNFEAPDALPYDKTRLARGVVVGDCVWFGDRVIVVPGVTIGEGAVLAAGAVITKDVPPLAVVGGAPARLIRSRNEEAYRTLRSEGRYLGWPRDYDTVNGRKVHVRRAR